MISILIIPPEDLDKAEFVIEFAKAIKDNYPETSISTIVNLKSYDLYYHSGCIDGFIIEPKPFWHKIFLVQADQFNLSIHFQKSIVWKLACWRAKIKNKLYMISDKDRQNYLAKLKNFLS